MGLVLYIFRGIMQFHQCRRIYFSWIFEKLKIVGSEYDQHEIELWPSDVSAELGIGTMSCMYRRIDSVIVLFRRSQTDRRLIPSLNPENVTVKFILVPSHAARSRSSPGHRRHIQARATGTYVSKNAIKRSDLILWETSYSIARV